MTAHDKLTGALVALAADGDRTPCAWPETLHWWTSDAAAERAEAALHCDGCAVLDACHDAAEENHELFVWGGRDRGVKP